MNPYYDNYRARPPRGWLYGILLTILTFWLSGVFWDGFRAHEMSQESSVGVGFILIANVLLAYQALTNDDYKKARGTLIARRVLMPLGVMLFVFGRQF
jgi:hypothetical protein